MLSFWPLKASLLSAHACRSFSDCDNDNTKVVVDFLTNKNTLKNILEYFDVWSRYSTLGMIQYCVESNAWSLTLAELVESQFVYLKRWGLLIFPGSPLNCTWLWTINVYFCDTWRHPRNIFEIFLRNVDYSAVEDLIVNNMHVVQRKHFFRIFLDIFILGNLGEMLPYYLTYY